MSWPTSKMTAVRGHALRPFGGDEDYDPFAAEGPWTAQCECGWTKRCVTQMAGRRFHRIHKYSVLNSGEHRRAWLPPAERHR